MIKKLIKNDFLKVFDQIDLLVTPVCFHDTPTYKEYIENAKIFDEKDFFTACVNIAGMPAITIPVCLSLNKKLPVGIQIIAKNNNEQLLLNAANFFIKNNLNNFSYLLNK